MEGAGLSWPLPEDMNDEALEAALYASRRSKRGHRRIEEPDWAASSRTEAQARHPVDPLGRVHRREPGRLQLLAVLRALSILRDDAVGD